MSLQLPWRRSLVTLAALATTAPLLVGCNPDAKAGPSLTKDGLIANINGGGFSSSANPQRNFNPYLPTALTTTFTYEPLFMVDNYNCDVEPWLATDQTYTDPTHLKVTLRQGVKWSDGQVLTAGDVAFTFDMIKKNPALDTAGAWANLASVEADGEDTVVFTLKEPSSSALFKVSNVKIVPEHVWSKVKDPTSYTNEKPVATGPFLPSSFNGTHLKLQRNKDYWNAKDVKVQQLSFSQPGDQDTDKLRLARGDYDFNTMFVTDIDKTFVDKDPDHNRYWFPAGADISLYLNLTMEPFNDVGFRKALSYAVDRDEIVDKAENGYVEPASPTGLLLPGQKDWLAPEYADGATVPYDPDEAKQMFTDAGYSYDSDGRLLDKAGKPLSIEFKVQAGYLDWVTAANIVKSNLDKVGIDVDVRTAAPADVENDRAIGNYEMEFGVHGGSCDMFENYDNPLGSDKTAPIGKPAVANFVRWQDPETDRLLAQLGGSPDVEKQKEAVAGLQRIMVEQVPTIPLWYGARWFQYRTKNATGWPSEQDPYAAPGDQLKIMTSLKPASAK